MTTAFDPQDLSNVHLVPLTAYDTSGQLNQTLHRQHIERMYAAGMRVFMPAAGTSEFHSLTADEVVCLVALTREASGDDAVVFAPVGLQVDYAIDIGVRAMKAGASGIMFMPFVHPYLSDSGARDYYRRVIEQVDAPTLIYKKAEIPSDSLLLELADDHRVLGVKYALNNLHAFRKILLAAERRLEFICGSAERFAPFYMLAGAGGFTTGAGNVCPHLSLAMHAAFAAGEQQEGMRLQQILLPIEDFRARQGDSYNISMLKHAMTLLGQDFGAPRPPQRQLAPEERAEIESLLQPILTAEKELESELSGVGLSKG